MSDSDKRLKMVEAVTGSVVEMKVSRDSGLRLLTGPAKVQLVVTAEDAATPEEAVEIVIRDLLRRGLDAYSFAVTDMETGEHYIVRAGEILSLKDARAEVEASEQEGDDGDGG